MVGGTRILRPAADELAHRGHPVTVVARRTVNESPLVFATKVVDARALAAALDEAISARGPFELALVYAPFAPAASMEIIAERATGRLVHVLTSRWRAPGADRVERDAWAPDGAGGRGTTQRITLGWKHGPEGPRWHTPEEISRGVGGARRGGRAAHERGQHETTVGKLRPWSERPSN